MHLANLHGEEKESIDLDSAEIGSKVHRLLRIAGSGNTEINKLSTLLSVSPDIHTKQFILNEGAFVIEGSKTVAELLNKYYPAYLFALNQKYLFNYMQEKINELPIEPTTGKYKTEDLKQLQETLIYAEFSQIFTSLSNYNEIDQFFEKLRDQFKIKQLKEEYFDSVNGISKITQIKEKEETDKRWKEEQNKKDAEKADRSKEKEKEEKLKEIEDKKNEENNKRLNNILLVLTIAQVWAILSDFFKDCSSASIDTYLMIVNICAYVVFLIFILLTFFNKK